MASPEASLRRLLSAREAARLLASFAGLLPGGRAALLDADGQPAAWHDPTAQAEGWAARAGIALRGHPDPLPGNPPVGLEGAAGYPLACEGRRLGWLIVEAPGPAGEALQAALALLLQERLEKRRLASETLERYREVNLLYHLAERFGASLDAAEVVQMALAETRRAVRAEGGIVWLTGGANQPGDPPACYGAPAVTGPLEAFLYRLLQDDPDIASANIAAHPVGGEGSLASILYAPLRLSGDLLGLVALGRPAGQPEFSAGEKNLLVALAGQAAGALEKALLHRQDLQRQQIVQELAIGQRIQRSLLPKTMPALPGWEFAASYQAANQVGGDFYDLFPLPGETGCQEAPRYGLTIADVSGKGIPAALMMAFSQAILHTAAFTQPGPGSVLFHTNRSILQSSRSGLMLSAFYAVLDPCTGDLTYANAGHEPPLLYRAAASAGRELPGGPGLLLGARRDQFFEERSTRMEPGDLLLLYTDGVTEARSPAGDFFEEERLYALVAQQAGRGCAALLAALNQALGDFTAGAAQSDDITLLALRRLLE